MAQRFRDTIYPCEKKDARQTHLLEFYRDKVQVDSEDKKVSSAIVRDTLKEIVEHVKTQPGGEWYSLVLQKAGSYAIGTKIGRADEFDWIVPLNIQVPCPIDFGGFLYFKFEDERSESLQNMNINLKTVETHVPRPGIQGGVIGYDIGLQLPFYMRHGNVIIPRHLKKDLYDKIKTALFHTGYDRRGVSLSSKAHGPALTLKITRPTAKSHDISVDIVISLPTADELTSFGWPLKATRRALTAQKIEDVKAAGLHLVPKSADVFDISFSKAERAILTGIDSGNGCRKMCHKVIKKYIESYRSHNPAEGISSHIFKHQLLNMMERYPDAEYWEKKNFGDRVVDMLEDCENILRRGMLPNYFKPMENILEGKDRRVLHDLANYFQGKRNKLQCL